MKIKFPIGDWSEDGHSRCEWYTIESNKSVDELRELHFSCQEALSFDIGDLCAEYAESRIPKKLTQQLLTLGILSENANIAGGEYYLKEPKELLIIWLSILKFLDPTFQYEIVDELIPFINFYGFDHKQRHLNTPGYGLFV